MGVAFTRKEDFEAAAAHLPDRPISPHLNLVTLEGLAALHEALAAARAAYATAQAAGRVQADRTAMAKAARDLRYYAARRASAQGMEPDRSTGAVVFGSRVTFDRGDQRHRTSASWAKTRQMPRMVQFPTSRRSRAHFWAGGSGMLRR